MNVFNSLGSNYNFLYVTKSLLWGKSASRTNLSAFLAEKYQGIVTLTYKGREAIELCLQSLKLEEGSGIAITGFTCIAVVDAIEKQKLKPVFLDIDSDTLNFSPETLEKEIKNKKIKAVIIQNTLGYPCDIEGIQRICKKHKVPLIEDLAHSIGLIYNNGKEAGMVGDYVILSFSQDKVIDAVSGGALISRGEKGLNKIDKTTYRNTRDQLYPLLTWTIRKTYPITLGKILHVVFRKLHLLSDPMKSSNKRNMSDWQAELILDGFETIEYSLYHRKRISEIYLKHLPDKIISKEIHKTLSHATNLRFPIFVDNREDLIKKLQNKGVYVSDIWYDAPVAPKKYLGLARYPKETCPQAEKISNRIMNLPTHINVSENDAQEIARLITTWLQ